MLGLIAVITTGCASFNSRNDTHIIQSTKEGRITYIMPENSCDNLTFGHSSRYYTSVSFNNNEISSKLVKYANKKMVSSTVYTVPFTRKNNSEECVISTSYPYKKQDSYSDPINKFLFSAPIYTTESLNYILLRNAKVSGKVSVSSKYQPASIYNNFSRALGHKINGSSNINTDSYSGKGETTINGLKVTFNLSISPYHDGSIVEINYKTSGLLRSNTVDFRSQIVEINKELTKIVNS